MSRGRAQRRFRSKLSSGRRKEPFRENSQRDTIDGRPISELSRQEWDRTKELDSDYKEETYIDIWEGLPIQ